MRSFDCHKSSLVLLLYYWIKPEPRVVEKTDRPIPYTSDWVSLIGSFNLKQCGPLNLHVGSVIQSSINRYVELCSGQEQRPCRICISCIHRVNYTLTIPQTQACTLYTPSRDIPIPFQLLYPQRHIGIIWISGTNKVEDKCTLRVFFRMISRMHG
jgi:hypothetical protein